MEKLRLLLKEANTAFKIADHMIYVTYPLVSDTKLLIVIIENLHKAITKGVEALLYYEFLYKRISNFPESFHERLRTFKESIARRYNFSQNNILLISDINEIVEKRKESPIEFVKKDKFVIASRDYRLRTINFDKTKNFVNETKMFISKLNSILKASDRRTTQRS